MRVTSNSGGWLELLQIDTSEFEARIKHAQCWQKSKNKKRRLWWIWMTYPENHCTSGTTSDKTHDPLRSHLWARFSGRTKTDKTLWRKCRQKTRSCLHGHISISVKIYVKCTYLGICQVYPYAYVSHWPQAPPEDISTIGHNNTLAQIPELLHVLQQHNHRTRTEWNLRRQLYSYMCTFSINKCTERRCHTRSDQDRSLMLASIWKTWLHYNDVIMVAIAFQITSASIVYSIVCSGADQRKHQSSASLAFVQGIHRPVNSPHRWIPCTKGQ